MPEATHDRRLRARIGRFLKEPRKRLYGYWLEVRARVPYDVAYALRRPFAPEPRTLYFFPAIPTQHNATIARICKLRGIRMAVGGPGDSPLTVWDDHTINLAPSPSGALNGRCTDIRKSTVDRIQREVFGFSAAVDPRNFDGAMVEKSEENAAHDGVVRRGPLSELTEGRVYQRLLTNDRNGLLEELRIAVVLGTIPHVVICWKTPAERFKRLAARARVVDATEALAAGECEQIAAFCDAIGLDFGELDAIRDPADGRLYILDANKTPIGPARALSLWWILASLTRFGRQLDRLWLRPRQPRR